MDRYIILLRGINVGGKNMLPMKGLVELLEKDNFCNVRTYIQSGNVVLEGSNRPENSLVLSIEKDFGFRPGMLVLSESELKAAIEKNPFSSAEGKAMHFYFCESAPNPDKEKIENLKNGSEKYQIDGCVFYLHAPDGIGRSRLVANIEACLDVRATGRNLNTVRKIQKLAESA
jgi:uncharacterized protein (DUF1697 family)